MKERPVLVVVRSEPAVVHNQLDPTYLLFCPISRPHSFATWVPHGNDWDAQRPPIQFLRVRHELKLFHWKRAKPARPTYTAYWVLSTEQQRPVWHGTIRAWGSFFSGCGIERSILGRVRGERPARNVVPDALSNAGAVHPPLPSAKPSHAGSNARSHDARSQSYAHASADGALAAANPHAGAFNVADTCAL